jgi:hypothetical protein
LILGLGIFGFIILYLKNQLGEKHELLQVIFLIFIPLIFLVLAHIGLAVSQNYAIEQASFSFYKITIWFLRVYYIYLFTYLAISVMTKIVNSSKKNRGED